MEINERMIKYFHETGYKCHSLDVGLSLVALRITPSSAKTGRGRHSNYSMNISLSCGCCLGVINMVNLNHSRSVDTSSVVAFARFLVKISSVTNDTSKY